MHVIVHIITVYWTKNHILEAVVTQYVCMGRLLNGRFCAVYQLAGDLTVGCSQSFDIVIA